MQLGSGTRCMSNAAALGRQNICRCNPDLGRLECSRGQSRIGTLLAMRLRMHRVEVQTPTFDECGISLCPGSRSAWPSGLFHEQPETDIGCESAVDSKHCMIIYATVCTANVSI